MSLSRRSVILSLASLLSVGTADAKTKHKAHGDQPKNGKTSTPVAKLIGNPLLIPPLIEPKPSEALDLTAGTCTHAFSPDKPVQMIGYGGQHLGPTVRLKRGTTTRARLTNRLERVTNVHWHGLHVDSTSDGALTSVAPGESWETTLAVDQPSATLWYHAHVHGNVGADIHDGLAGMLIVEDPADASLGLPKTYGVDDFPLILQDKIFDAAGKPAYEVTPAVREHGFRGSTIVVNGTVDPLLKVPQRLVRLRLLNAANARVFRLYMDDQRSFSLVATDGGYLEKPAVIDTLTLSPGERVEIIVDFADGSTSLMSTPDNDEHRMGTEVMSRPDSFAGPFRVIGFEAVKDAIAAAPLPATLPVPTNPAMPDDPRHRRFVLEMGSATPTSTAVTDPHAGHVMPGMSATPDPHAGHKMPGTAAATLQDFVAATINAKSFEMGRIDETVPFGATEIWEVTSRGMAHPFHVHGAQFTVLSEGDNPPRAWNRGLKDTVYVETNVVLLVTFTRHADAKVPFLYHCHVLEHEDAGMMGTFTVT